MATSYSPYSRARSRSETTLRVEALLGRYPNLSEQELAELINLFPTLNILDHGLITADDALSGNLVAFQRDHGKKLKPSVSSLILFLAVPVTFAIVTLWFVIA